MFGWVSAYVFILRAGGYCDRTSGMRNSPRVLFTLLVLSSLWAQTPVEADHHQHLLSPAAAARAGVKPISASDLIREMDRAGIRRAAVLSVAYGFGNPNKVAVENEYAQVRAENDWTSVEVAKYPVRLRGFCSVNPLKAYALDEIARCAKDPHVHYGLKLHFGNSDVQLENPTHLEQVRRVFRTANEHKMAIAVHMHSTVNLKRPYGAEQARMFLGELLPVAPDITVQIAHLAGAGGYDEVATDDAVGVFVDAVKRRDPRMTRVYFDASGVAGLGNWQERAALIAQRMRELGLGRILYGSDAPVPGNLPVDVLAKFRQLPLSKAEFQTIESNVAPYLK